MKKQNNNLFYIFFAMFFALFSSLFSLIKKSSPKNTQDDNKDVLSSKILDELKQCLDEFNLFLNFNEVFAHIKNLQENHQLDQVDDYIAQQELLEDKMWEKVHVLDLDFSSIPFNVNLDENENEPSINDKLSKFWKLPSNMKNVLVSRGKILRQIKKICKNDESNKSRL